MKSYAGRKKSWQRQKHKQGSCQVQGEKDVTMQADMVSLQLFIPFPRRGMDFGRCLIQDMMTSTVMSLKSNMHSRLGESTALQEWASSNWILSSPSAFGPLVLCKW